MAPNYSARPTSVFVSAHLSRPGLADLTSWSPRAVCYQIWNELIRYETGRWPSTCSTHMCLLGKWANLSIWNFEVWTQHCTYQAQPGTVFAQAVVKIDFLGPAWTMDLMSIVQVTGVARGGPEGPRPSPATEKKYQIRHQQICSFKPKVHQNLFSARAAPDPAGAAYEITTSLVGWWALA